MEEKNKKYLKGKINIALNAVFNEVQRMMFNLEVRRQRLIEYSRSTEENALRLKRRIRNLIELKQYEQAKYQTRNLVETNYKHMTMSVVAKKIGSVLTILREKLKKPGVVDSYLVTFLKKADRAVRGEDLREMDSKLTKLKRYIQPEIYQEDIPDIKIYLNAIKESDVNKIYNELYEEVNLVQSLAGLRAKPVLDPIVRIPEIKTEPALKKREIKKTYGPHHFELR